MKKKRRKKVTSRFFQEEGECFLCARLERWPVYHKNLERHHIYWGSRHEMAEQYGFTVNLCAHHHRGDEKGNKDAVHSPDKNDYGNYIKRWAQNEFEKDHSREEFMEIFGKSWL